MKKRCRNVSGSKLLKDWWFQVSAFHFFFVHISKILANWFTWLKNYRRLISMVIYYLVDGSNCQIQSINPWPQFCQLIEIAIFVVKNKSTFTQRHNDWRTSNANKSAEACWIGHFDSALLYNVHKYNVEALRKHCNCRIVGFF